MKKYSYLLLLLLSLIILSCGDGQVNDAYPTTYLCTCNIDGSELEVAGLTWRGSYLADAVFTGDGRKLTDGARFMNFDGTDLNAIFLTPRDIRDYCFNSTGSDYFCISYGNDGFPSGLVKYNFLEDNYESIIDTINVYDISISKDDELLAVANWSTVYIIDISTKTITAELDLSTHGKVVFGNDNNELYFKENDNVGSPIKSINLTSLEIKEIASRGEITRHNQARTRFVYIYNNICEMLEIDGSSYNVTSLSSPNLRTYKPSMNRQGDLVVYHSYNNLIINYLDTIGEVLLRESIWKGVISPQGDKYLFYKTTKNGIK